MDKTLKKEVSKFMTKDVVAVHENDEMKKVFKLMDKHGILGLPVLSDEGGVVGIVTESDLLPHFKTLKNPKIINVLGSLVYLENLKDFNENLKDHCAQIVKDIMNTDVATIRDNATLNEVIDLMAERKVSRLPVIGEMGELVGIVTRKDVVHEIAKMKTV